MKHLILIITFLITILSLKAQNPAPPATFEIFTTIYNQESQLSVADLLSGSTISNDSADYSLKIVLTLLDTINIANIHLSVGDTLNGNNIINTVIPFDSLNTTTQYREGSIIYIQSDTLFNLNNVYGNIFLEDVNGNNSTIINYQSN